ncbi:MAG TPA: hypothetical protein VNV39_22645, partial [Stellaceae bacterium]|nr:hypothetical protein [Stellaceae bacterium]
PTAAPGAQPMGIVARHPIAAPVAAPETPPAVVFAAGLGEHAASPATSAIVLKTIVFITVTFFIAHDLRAHGG